MVTELFQGNVFPTSPAQVRGEFMRFPSIGRIGNALSFGTRDIRECGLDLVPEGFVAWAHGAATHWHFSLGLQRMRLNSVQRACPFS